MDENDAGVGGGKGEDEGGEFGEEVGGGGVEGGLEVGGEFVRRRIAGRGRGREGWEGGVVEVEVVVEGGGGEIPAVEAVAGLADVRGGRDVVDGDAAAGEVRGEVEERVEMALCRERNHHYYNGYKGLGIAF